MGTLSSMVTRSPSSVRWGAERKGPYVAHFRSSFEGGIAIVRVWNRLRFAKIWQSARLERFWMRTVESASIATDSEFIRTESVETTGSTLICEVDRTRF